VYLNVEGIKMQADRDTCFFSSLFWVRSNYVSH